MGFLCGPLLSCAVATAHLPIVLLLPARGLFGRKPPCGRAQRSRRKNKECACVRVCAPAPVGVCVCARARVHAHVCVCAHV